MRSLAGLLLLVVLRCGPEPTGRPRDAGTAEPPEPAPMAASELDSKVRAVHVRADVPLDGVEPPVTPGDLLIESSAAAALVSGVDGRVVAFGPPRGRNGLEGFGPAAFD